MSVTQVGTPAATAYFTTAGSNTVTNTWSATQPRTAGDTLVMVITGSAATSVTAITAPAGWQTAYNTGNAATAHSRTACFYTTATGGDAAPSVTVTTSSTTRLACTLFELSGVAAVTPVGTTGTTASGSTSATLSSMTATAAAVTSTPGAFAIASFARERTAGTTTITHTAGWASFSDDGSTSAVGHNTVATLSGPAVNTAAADTCSFSGTATSAFGTGGIAVFLPPRPKAATFTDAFATNDLSTNWSNSVGTFGWSTGQVTVQVDTAGSSALVTTAAYDLTSSAVYAQITPYAGGTGGYTWFQVNAVASNQYVSATGVQFDQTAGTLEAYTDDASGAAVILTPSAAWNATAMAYWRIRESAGTLYFDYGPDGSSWTSLLSMADPTNLGLDLTNVYFTVAGILTSGTAGNSILQNVNVSPGVTVTAGLAHGAGAAGNASLTAQSALASGTGTALQPAVQVTGNTTANAGLARGTGTALNGAPVARGGLAHASASGYAPAAALTVPAGLAHGAGTAQNGTRVTLAGLAAADATQTYASGPLTDPSGSAVTDPSGSAVTTAAGGTREPTVLIRPGAGQAAGAGAAVAPAFAFPAGLAHATGTAQPALAAVSAGGLAHGTGSALSGSLVAYAGLAHGTGSALPPAVQTTGFTTANAGLAHGSGTALRPYPAVPAGLAHGTGTAPGAAVVLVRQPQHLGAAVSYLNYAGGITEASTGGSAVTVANLLGGAAAPVNAYAGSLVTGNAQLGGTASVLASVLGGTLGYNAFGGSLTGWTMQQTTLAISEFNDETINIAITNNGSPYNLTGVTVQMLFKTAAGTPDSQALVFSSAGVSPAITVTNAAGGLATAVIPNTDLDAETYNFFRIDVVSSGLVNTCLYGPITWTSL